jgi:hypothetical protein
VRGGGLYPIPTPLSSGITSTPRRLRTARGWDASAVGPARSRYLELEPVVSSVDSLSGRWAKTHASRDETLRSRDRSLLAKITGEHIIDVDRRHHRYSLGASDRPRKAESLPAAASHLAAARFWPTSSRSLPTETVDMSALSTPSICGNNGRGHSKCSSSFIPRWSVLTITAETWRDQVRPDRDYGATGGPG